VDLTYTDLSMSVSLGARSLTVHREGQEVGTFPVAVGEDATPTPTGFFYIKELLAPDDRDGPYGVLAYGLSGHSNEVDNAQFPDGVIGIHGTDRPDLIGQAVSHGCLRMRNQDIYTVASLELPLGTPVTIGA
jgi:lipoprotein-anchoring transpeptidase ErfK/SrfK